MRWQRFWLLFRASAISSTPRQTCRLRDARARSSTPLTTLRHHRGSGLDGFANAAVGAAAADVLDRVDVGIGGILGAPQKIGGGHDPPGLTEAPLRQSVLQPGLLHRVR